jgi:hypothetical protein
MGFGFESQMTDLVYLRKIKRKFSNVFIALTLRVFAPVERELA